MVVTVRDRLKMMKVRGANTSLLMGDMGSLTIFGYEREVVREVVSASTPLWQFIHSAEG